MMKLLHDRFVSPIGAVHVVSDGKRLFAVDFGELEDRLAPFLRKRFGDDVRLEALTDAGGFTSAFRRYFDGDLDAVSALPTDSGGTPFQRRVWASLMHIRAGETKTYGELATELGDANASRAVGLANGRNPVSITVPCHRVIGANGALTGYGGGIERKRWLLQHEGALPAEQGEMFG